MYFTTVNTIKFKGPFSDSEVLDKKDMTTKIA